MSLITRSGMRVVATPLTNGPNSSQTESTKLREVFAQHFSFGMKGNLFHIRAETIDCSNVSA